MNMNRILKLAASCLVLFSLGVPTYGQKFWDKKPYQQWSDFEAVQLIVDSPWAKMVRDHASLYSTNIRLHSALTLRQALVRRKQIRRNYDKLSPADKANFDSQVQEELECADCAKYYILTLAIIPRDERIVRSLSGLSLDELKGYVFLANEKGDRRNLVTFIPPRYGGDNALLFESAVFYFERFDDHRKPLLTTDNKKLYFSIDDKVFKGKFGSLSKVTFEVSKLIRNGEIVF